jgi:hypothetical protein
MGVDEQEFDPGVEHVSAVQTLPSAQSPSLMQQSSCRVYSHMPVHDLVQHDTSEHPLSKKHTLVGGRVVAGALDVALVDGVGPLTVVLVFGAVVGFVEVVVGAIVVALVVVALVVVTLVVVTLVVVLVVVVLVVVVLVVVSVVAVSEVEVSETVVGGSASSSCPTRPMSTVAIPPTIDSTLMATSASAIGPAWFHIV